MSPPAGGATSSLKIGIAGSGFAAKFHLENFPNAHVEVVGVTSARPQSRESFAAQHGLRVFESVEEMLPAIDVLDICTPPSSHHDYILAAARAGKHIIVEKPLTGFYGSPEKFDKRQMLEGVIQAAPRCRKWRGCHSGLRGKLRVCAFGSKGAGDCGALRRADPA